MTSRFLKIVLICMYITVTPLTRNSQLLDRIFKLELWSIFLFWYQKVYIWPYLSFVYRYILPTLLKTSYFGDSVLLPIYIYTIMIPLFHMELRLSDIGKDWDLRRGSVRLTIKYKLNFLKKLDLTYIMCQNSRMKHKLFINKFIFYKSDNNMHSYNTIKIETSTM